MTTRPRSWTPAAVLALGGLLAPAAAVVADPARPAPRPAPNAAASETSASAEPPAAALPEPVLYGQMFRHVVALEQRADALEKRGEDGGELRLRYKQSAELSDRQERMLKDVARDCMAEVAAQDRKALALIRAARARNPDGRLEPGQTPPLPPAELATLQEERDAMVLAARDRLRQAFGEEEFARLDGFVHRSLGPHIRRISPEIPHSPRASQRPLPSARVKP